MSEDVLKRYDIDVGFMRREHMTDHAEKVQRMAADLAAANAEVSRVRCYAENMDALAEKRAIEVNELHAKLTAAESRVRALEAIAEDEGAVDRAEEAYDNAVVESLLTSVCSRDAIRAALRAAVSE